MHEKATPIGAQLLIEWLRDARRRTLDLVADLDDAQLLGPRLAIVNPLRWEIGHIAWFQEKWVLRHVGGEKPIRADADALYDSAAIPHEVRWDLPLPERRATLAYMQAVQDRIIERLDQRPPTDQETYFVLLSIFHEDMHGEAFAYTRQTLGYPKPRWSTSMTNTGATGGGLSASANLTRADERRGACDIHLPGGTLLLGAVPDEPFVFDNEKWAHEVEVKPFAMARSAVTQAEFAAFVNEDGYQRRELWSEAGWQWRQLTGAEHPVYWRSLAPHPWQRRDYDQWVSLEPDRPVVHVNWYEAEAYCNWAGRRLPTEAEWEFAASTTPSPPIQGEERRQVGKRRFPWGDEPPRPGHANLDGRARGCVAVDAHPSGDSACGIRQLIGNVWEWTASDFLPYPGFVPDPYREYSQPWFGTHKVLRGGCWATRARLIRNTWRNFYTPDRRDVWSGFRTCARAS